MSLRTTVSHLPDDVTMVAVEGRITLGDSCDALETELKSLLNAGHNKVVIQASRLNYLDSAGIGLLIMAACKAQAAGGSLCITGAKAWVHDAITRCRIENILRFAEDTDQGAAMAATSTTGTGTAG